jgi:hypothetical protein
MQSCFFKERKVHPGPSTVKESLEHIFEGNATDTITCKQWLTTDRLTLKTTIKSNEDNLDTSIDKLLALLWHLFMVVQHSMKSTTELCGHAL